MLTANKVLRYHALNPSLTFPPPTPAPPPDADLPDDDEETGGAAAAAAVVVAALPPPAPFLSPTTLHPSPPPPLLLTNGPLATLVLAVVPEEILENVLGGLAVVVAAPLAAYPLPTPTPDPPPELLALDFAASSSCIICANVFFSPPNAEEEEVVVGAAALGEVAFAPVDLDAHCPDPVGEGAAAPLAAAFFNALASANSRALLALVSRACLAAAWAASVCMISDTLVAGAVDPEGGVLEAQGAGVAFLMGAGTATGADGAATEDTGFACSACT